MAGPGFEPENLALASDVQPTAPRGQATLVLNDFDFNIVKCLKLTTMRYRLLWF